MHTDINTDNTLIFFWTRISRITRIFYCTLILRIFYFAHGSHESHGSAYASHGSRIKNIRLIRSIRVQKSHVKDPWDPWDPCAKNIRLIRLITSLRSVGLRRISCSKTIISCSTNINHRSEFFLNTNNPNNTNIFWHTDLTDLTDLLAYGLLLLWDSWICNITQKMTSVSHAKHRQIREICEIRVL